MWIEETPSSHTVCQIPVVGVYQMPRGLFDLFAARLRAAAGGVPDGYKYLLPVTRHCCGSDIESKGIVSTPVLSGLSSVDPDDTLPVNSPEMPR